MNFKNILLLLVLVIGISAFTRVEISDPTGTEIIKKAEAKLKGTTSKSTLKMTVQRSDWSRTIEMKGWSKGDQYSLTLITAPARDKGAAFLKRDKEIWNWQPSIDRSIKLPPSMMMQSWMGSDLTNDDLVSQSSIVIDYTHDLQGEETVEGRNCYKILLTPKEDAPVVWGKVVMWVDKAEDMQMKTEFYDEDDYLINTILGKNVKKLGGRLLPSTLEVIPADEPGHKTILEYVNLEFGVDIPDSFFSVQNMKRVR